MRALLELVRRLAGSLRPLAAATPISKKNCACTSSWRPSGEHGADARRRRPCAQLACAPAAQRRRWSSCATSAACRRSRRCAADVVFGWRQLVRHRTASVSAILSLGLALGATTGGVPARRHGAAAPAAGRRSVAALRRHAVRSHDMRRTVRRSATTSTIRPIARTSHVAGGQADVLLMGSARRGADSSIDGGRARNGRPAVRFRKRLFDAWACGPRSAVSSPKPTTWCPMGIRLP